MERTVSSLLKANAKQFSCKDTCESNQTEGVEALQSYEYAAGWNPIAVYPYVEVHSENKLRVFGDGQVIVSLFSRCLRQTWVN